MDHRGQPELSDRRGCKVMQQHRGAATWRERNTQRYGLPIWSAHRLHAYIELIAGREDKGEVRRLHGPGVDLDLEIRKRRSRGNAGELRDGDAESGDCEVVFGI